MNIKTCEEYVLAELEKLQFECERMQKRIAELEFENNHLHSRIGKMEPEVHRLSKKNYELWNEMHDRAREELLDSTWANDMEPVDGLE